MEEQFDHALHLLGLNKNERKIYLDTIKHGKSSVLDISKRTGIHRTNVYDALRELEQKGFILEVIEEKKKFFKARSPDKLKSYVLQIQNEVDALIPLLKSVVKSEPEIEGVSMLKGTPAVRDALQSLIELKSPIYVYGASRESLNIFGEGFLNYFHKKRVSKKIIMNHIYHHDAPERIAHLNKMKYTEARYLPKKFDSAVSTAICGDIVLLIIFTEPASLIKIKNRKIAEAYSKYFEILWAKSHR